MVPEMKQPLQTYKAWRFPVASAMVKLVEESRCSEIGLLEQYMCYWVAFGNICVTIADDQGCRAALLTSDEQLQLEQVGGLSMPRVRMPTEREWQEVVYKVFSPQLTESLILHRYTRFFVNRLPWFQGEELMLDARGQQLNGVLDVGRTVDAKNPVWCPIDQALYYAYVHGERTSAAAETLGKAILSLLYTIGKNRFHSSNRTHDMAIAYVVERGLPLLKEVVKAFV